MPRGKKTQDTTLLEMALVGYESEKAKIDEKIEEIRALIGASQATKKTAKRAYNRKAVHATVEAEVPAKRRTLSASARKRIAIAQKKRWAEHRKTLAASAQE